MNDHPYLTMHSKIFAILVEEDQIVYDIKNIVATYRGYRVVLDDTQLLEFNNFTD